MLLHLNRFLLLWRCLCSRYICTTANFTYIPFFQIFFIHFFFWEGAGANVLARFGLAHAARCLGLILINCTGSAASVLDSFKTKVKQCGSYLTILCNKSNSLSKFSLQFIKWKTDEVAQSAEDFLLYHKFGHVSVISILFHLLFHFEWIMNWCSRLTSVLLGWN